MSTDPDTAVEDELLEAARRVRERAWAKYSDFAVGAALLADDGSIHVGCNVENASYGLTVCAERVAVGAAVAAGHTRFTRLALTAEDRESEEEKAVPPCGACRQVLLEFGPDLRIVSEGGRKRRRWTLRELLPAAFALEGSGAPDDG